METSIVHSGQQVEGQQQLAAVTLSEGAREYARKSRSENTKGSYKSDWEDFKLWCAARGAAFLPAAPSTVASYVADRAANAYDGPGPRGTIRRYPPCTPATLGRRLVSISQAHKIARLPVPIDEAVRSVLKGIRRDKGTAQDAKAPVLVAQLQSMVQTSRCSAGPVGKRNRALLLLGFAGGFRRSELVALDVADLDFHSDPAGLVVTIRRSKTDQEGAGRQVGIPYGHGNTCPVKALRIWLDAAVITEGPVFRPVNRHDQVGRGRLTAQSVALVVKSGAAAVDLDPSRFAGHSLRSGLATSAAAAGVSERSIMNQTGHTSEKMVRRYIRAGSLFQDNAAAGVGL
jgi:site-specific recombinase XerD